MSIIVEEEKKETAVLATTTQADSILTLADPEDIAPLIFTKILPYNMVSDLNVALGILKHLTTDVEEEDQTKFYCERSDYLDILTLMFFIL